MRLFISHSSGNNPEAIALRDWLIAEEGWDDLFLDLDPSGGIAAGERWDGGGCTRRRTAARRCSSWSAAPGSNRSGVSANGPPSPRSFNKRIFGILIEEVGFRCLTKSPQG